MLVTKNINIKLITVMLIIALLLINIKPFIHLISDIFTHATSIILDKEDEERLRSIENGSPVGGKDTVRIWHNMYELWRNQGENNLSISNEEISEVILENVYTFKKIKKSIYIVSEEGYAIIDSDKLCRVFVTVEPDKFTDGYSIDKNGNRKYISRFLEDEHVQYLNGFDEFSEEEQTAFKRLGEKEDNK